MNQTRRADADVPCPSQFADDIKVIYDAGIPVGCGGGSDWPNTSITNAPMAVYLVRRSRFPTSRRKLDQSSPNAFARKTAIWPRVFGLVGQ